PDMTRASGGAGRPGGWLWRLSRLAAPRCADRVGWARDHRVCHGSSPEYVGFVWLADKPAIRLRLLASAPEDARSRVVAEYGEGHVMSLWNEEDASKPR
ncbi:hypothetical protein, partial [Micromonospora haikouensis]|uniref:hypothetical protein n=1 Tax=Micromonospora haikouensis TaxID=686309 RepID=UPI003D711202